MTIKLSVPACNHRAESSDMRGLDAWSAPMKDGPSVARGPREAVWGVAGNSRPTRPNDRLVMITVLCHNWKENLMVLLLPGGTTVHPCFSL